MGRNDQILKRMRLSSNERSLSEVVNCVKNESCSWTFMFRIDMSKFSWMIKKKLVESRGADADTDATDFSTASAFTLPFLFKT